MVCKCFRCVSVQTVIKLSDCHSITSDRSVLRFFMLNNQSSVKAQNV